MRSAVKVEAMSMDYEQNGSLNLKWVYQNNSKKDVRMFDGDIEVCDILDRELAVLPLTVGEPLKAGESVQVKSDWDQGVEELKDKEFQNLKFIWKPAHVEFADGEKLSRD